MVTPDKAGPGVFMLQNVEWAGLHIAIKSHKVQTVSEYTHNSIQSFTSYKVCSQLYTNIYISMIVSRGPSLSTYDRKCLQLSHDNL